MIVTARLRLEAKRSLDSIVLEADLREPSRLLSLTRAEWRPAPAAGYPFREAVIFERAAEHGGPALLQRHNRLGGNCSQQVHVSKSCRADLDTLDQTFRRELGEQGSGVDRLSQVGRAGSQRRPGPGTGSRSSPWEPPVTARWRGPGETSLPGSMPTERPLGAT
jgi:hypothetical protein